LNLDEWSRKDIYASVLLGTDADAALANESIRLDSVLSNSLIVFDRTSKNYLIPGFDPKVPMAEQP
jgi:hypothetical protein